MLKRSALAVVAVFLTWIILDFLIHGVILMSLYAETSDLWRPMEEMMMSMSYLVNIVAASCFVAIYSLLVKEKSLMAGIKLGLLFGIATGFSMGFGTYGSMPVPISLAWGWFLGSVVEMTAAGAIVGAIVTPQPETAHSVA